MKYSLEEEQSLILRAQTGDKTAMKRLRLMFEGTIQDSIKQSKVSSQNIPEGALQNQALKAFRAGILNYDAGTGNKPNTYITSYIKNDLKNMESSYQNETRIQPTDGWSLKSIMGAKRQLEGEGFDEPTSEQIQAKVKDAYGKDMTTDYIDGTLGKQRRELSVNTSIGEDGVGENITFGEIADVDVKTGKDYLKEGQDSEKLNRLLGALDANERGLYEQINGIGKFKGGARMGVGEFAKAKGISAPDYYKTNKSLNSEYHQKKALQTEMDRIEAKLKASLKTD